MEDSFKLPVIYKGQELELDAQLITYGYSHRFHVNIDGVTVLFEPDEEGHYRALLDHSTKENEVKLNTERIRIVGKKLQELFGK